MTRSAIILRYMAHNYCAGLRHWIGRADSFSGSLDGVPADYSRRVFENYLRRGGIEMEALRGASVLELGPGASLGVAELFVEAGASRVVALDKFRYTHRRVPDRVVVAHGDGIERAKLERGAFDLIVSNAVLEESADLARGFAAMRGALRPGGKMLHQIDLSDYGIFSRHGYHPLEFLTVPDGLYRAMTGLCGGPNRVMVNVYRKWVDKVEVTHWYEDFNVEEIRSRLLERYRVMASQDLLVRGIFVKGTASALKGCT